MVEHGSREGEKNNDGESQSRTLAQNNNKETHLPKCR